jgi:hypothetical protein
MKHHVLFLFFSLCSLIAAEQSNFSVFALAAINNRSTHAVSITNGKKIETVNPLVKKLLRRNYVVPFVSLRQYLDQRSLDDLYVPKEALLITTARGTFAVWEDETGIIATLRYEQGKTSKTDCVPYKILNSVDTQSHVARVIALMLVITAQDDIKMQEIA